MIDHQKASSRNQVDNNAASADLKLKSNADALKYSIKSLSNSKNNRCVVCYKLLHTWKGSRLCRYYDVNSEIRGGKKRTSQQQVSSSPNSIEKTASDVAKPKAELVEEVQQAMGGRLRSKRTENKTSSVDEAAKKSKGADEHAADVSNLVNGNEVQNHHGDSNNFLVSTSSSSSSLSNSNSVSNHKTSSNVSSYKYTIGDLISKTLSLKSAAASAAKPHQRSVQLEEDDGGASLRSGKICDCCLDNLSLIDYHMNHSSQLKAKMIRKFKLASKFHSNRFTLSRKCLTKRLRGANKQHKRTTGCQLAAGSFLEAQNRFRGLNGYRRLCLESNSKSYQLDHDKIDKLNSLLENVSLIASAILNNSKTHAKPEAPPPPTTTTTTRNGIVVTDDNQERQAVKNKSSSASGSVIGLRNHNELRNQHQPRIIESNELINNLNKLSNQHHSSNNNNNNSGSLSRNRAAVVENPVVNKPFKAVDTNNMLLTLAALVKGHQEAMNGQSLKFNLNQSLTNGNLFGQDQFGDQQQSNSLSPQETNRRKRKSIVSFPTTKFHL